MSKPNEIIAYVTTQNAPPLGLMFDGETIWVTQEQIADLFGTSKQVVSYHINKIFETKEVSRATGVKEILTTVEKQGERQIQHYNLDVVISVGYKVNSAKATRFRKWSTQILRERILGSSTTLSRDEQRLMISDRVAVENNELIQNARELGVKNDAAFLNAGYQGMYGMKMDAIKKKKDLGDDRLLDRASVTELAANEFRITQANALLKDYVEEDGLLVGHGVALQTHWRVGQHVRNAIGEIGGTMPEDLEVEPDHISDVRKRILTDKVKPSLPDSSQSQDSPQSS